MKPYRLLIPLLAAASPALAISYTVRTLPAGFDAARLSGGWALVKPIAADFMGNGRLQWYQGGSVISDFPAGGTLTLPAITLPQTPSATARPLSAAVCDVDRDGDTDIVRINEWNGNLYEYTLQVFLNNGSGTFSIGYRLDWTNSPSWAEGEHKFQIVAGDYNKNGTVDLAILENYSGVRQDTDPNRYEGKLYVRWNDGTGGFASSTTLQTNGLPDNSYISTADYNRDGAPDIYCSLYTTFGPDKLFDPSDEYDRSLLFTNNGAGAFTVGSNFNAVMPLQLVDITGDGWADLADPRDRALNSGDGSIGSPSDLTPSGGVWSNASPYTFTQFDHDNLADLVFAHDATLNVLNNDGGGTFSQAPLPFATLSASPDGLGAADSDGDGDLDYFVSFANGTFAFIENRELHLHPGARLEHSVILNGVTGLKSGDLNRDGFDDLLAVAPAQNSLWMAYGTANSTPGTAIAKLTQGQAPHSVAMADFDNDGLTDVAYTLPATGQVRIARNTGVTFSAWQDFAVATGLTGVSQMVCGEYGTPNGRPDLFTSNATTGQIRALYQSGSSWAGQTIFSALSPVAGSIIAGQFSSTPGDELTILSANAASLSLLTAHLSGGWNQLGSAYTDTVTNGPHTSKVIWADANGDSREEPVFITGSGALAFWFPGTGLSVSIGAAPSAIRDVAAVDWNIDGRTDFLCATATGLCLFHYRSDTLAWTRTDLYTPATGGYNAVAIMDLDHDNRPDAAAADITLSRLHYFLNYPLTLKGNTSSLPQQVEMKAGKTTDLCTLPVTSAGRPVRLNGLADINAAVTRLTLEFSSAVANPDGTWSPGAALSGYGTRISSVSLFSGNSLLDTEDMVATASGRLSLELSGTPVPIAPAQSVPHTVRFGVAGGPLSGPTRFFVKVIAVTGQGIDGVPLAPFGDSGDVTGTRPILVSLVPDYTLLQAWRAEHFGSPDSTGNGANNADYDGDGILNIAEYLAGTDPTAAEAANSTHALAVLTTSAQSPVNLRLVLNNEALADPKVKVTIQWSITPGAWIPFTSHTGGGNWTGGVTPQLLTADAGYSTAHFFNTGVTPAGTKRQFFRLKIEELP